MTNAEWADLSILSAYFLGVPTTDVILLRRIGRRLREQHPEAWKAFDVFAR